jgi:hypothetical protein
MPKVLSGAVNKRRRDNAMTKEKKNRKTNNDLQNTTQKAID